MLMRSQLSAWTCSSTHAQVLRSCGLPARRGSSCRAAASLGARPVSVRRHGALPVSPSTPFAFGGSLARGRSGCGARQLTVVRSFLGVGAPEAILVAVVALVVFGPKGLADAAKSLGQTLRAFQPTIREVVEVSQEIKGTLEQELGLDEIRNAAAMRPTPRPPVRSDVPAADAPAADAPAPEAAAAAGSAPSGLQPVTEQQARALDPDIELKRAMSEQAAWGGAPPSLPAQAAAAADAVPAAMPTGGDAAATKELSQLSMEELEAELARRKNAA